MDPRPAFANPGSKSPSNWVCGIVVAVLLVAAAGVGLVISLVSFLDHGSTLRASAQDEGAFATSSSGRFRDPYRTLEKRKLQILGVHADESAGGGLLKQYTSFAKYALERSNSSEPLPLPLVAPIGERSLLSIPLITIIGVQKGGTTNLRRNLLTHPLVTGMPNEVHFFDQDPDIYPRLGHWQGDGRERELSPGAIGRILSMYAKTCLEEGKPKTKPAWHKNAAAMSRGVIVESSPRYILSPIAPYRMRMVLPRAKLVVVLRDPTDRYFSQLRMVMCKTEPDPGYMSLEEQISTHFHPPGQAKGYIKRAEAAYKPYGEHCRGENATSTDLWNCYKAMATHNPLHRGLYADQLERWFRVYDKSQILVIDSAEMFVNFTETVAIVAEWAGLPEHEFEYDKHEFKGACRDKVRYHNQPDFFADGGRYETMLEEEDLLREWYRPHTERLEELLGRKMMW